MKYCIYCGAQIEDGSQFCANCGAAVEGQATATAPNEASAKTETPMQQETFTATPVQPVSSVKKNNGFAVAGLVLGIVSLFSWICCLHVITCVLAVIFSAIALSQIKKTGEQGRGMAIAGLVLGIVIFVIFFIGGFVMQSYGMFVLDEAMNSDIYDYYDYYDGYYDDYYSYGDSFDYGSFSPEINEA